MTDRASLPDFELPAPGRTPTIVFAAYRSYPDGRDVPFLVHHAPN